MSPLDGPSLKLHENFICYQNKHTYLKNTGWSLNEASSAEKFFSSSPLAPSTELALWFGEGCFGPGKETTRFGSFEVLKCLGKLQVTSAPGDLVTENKGMFEVSSATLERHGDQYQSVYMPHFTE